MKWVCERCTMVNTAGICNRCGKPKDIEFDNLKAMNETRRLMKMPPILIKQRICLNCDHEFKSRGMQNRLCDVCRNKEEISRA